MNALLDRPRTKMAKKPKQTKEQSDQQIDGKQIGLRLPPSLLADVEYCAERLGLDMAPFIRMVLTENLGRYKRRVKQIEAGDSAESVD